MRLSPPMSGIDAVHVDIPIVDPVCPVAAFLQTTEVSPTLSAAMPPSATVPAVVDSVEADVGVWICATGAMTSPPGGVYVTVIVSVATLPDGSAAVAVMT